MTFVVKAEAELGLTVCSKRQEMRLSDSTEDNSNIYNSLPVELFTNGKAK